MKIAVLGSSGFIGRNFIHQLISRKITPRVIVREELSALAGCENVHVPSFTINSLSRALRDAEVVINFIGRFPKPFSTQVATNVDVLSTICAAVDYTSIKQFIHISAAAAYGACMIPPTEEKSLAPDTTYGLSKLLGEEVIRYFSETHKLPYVVFRPTNVYGLGATAGVIYSMISSAKQQNVVHITGDGEQIRDFIYVDDAVRAIMEVILQNKRNKTYNLSSQELLTVRQLAAKIITRVNPNAALKFLKENKESIRKLTADNSLLREELGWSPLWTLDKGIDRVAQSV
jgi:UDP-glucose 4-epimerase